MTTTTTGPRPGPDDGHRVVAAIDLGTHGTGYAWAECSVLNADLRSREIYFNDRWPGANLAYPKNLSALLLNPSGDVTEWGFAAEERWNELQQAGENDGWGYAYAFKMALKPGGGASVATARGTVDLTDPDTVRRLIAAYLGRIKDAVLAEISGSGWAMHHVRWCITVPAIWDLAERAEVRKAAVDAGLPDDDDLVLIAVEPEAAALYCSLRLTQLLDDKGTEEYLALRTEGTRFLVVDCGGGTVDLTAHKTVLSPAGEPRLDDIGAPTGGALGSEYLNRAFRTTVLADRFGADVLRRLDGSCPLGLARLESDWEAAKVTARAELVDGVPAVTSRARIMIPAEVWSQLDAATQERVTARAGGFTGRLVLEPAEVQAVFDTVVDDILVRVADQLAEMRRVTGTSGDEILLLIGGFARSEYLRLRIRHRFADEVTVMAPPDPAAAVLFGAVHYCYDPNLIRSRRSKLTYGFDITQPFDPAQDPVEKRFKDETGRVLCSGRFEIAVRRGEPVEVDEPFFHGVLPVLDSQDAIAVHFYATHELDPRYVDDAGSAKIAELELDLSEVMNLPKDERAVGIYLYFGRTEVQADAKVMATGRKVATTFEFRSRF